MIHKHLQFYLFLVHLVPQCGPDVAFLLVAFRLGVAFLFDSTIGILWSKLLLSFWASSMRCLSLSIINKGGGALSTSSHFSPISAYNFKTVIPSSMTVHKYGSFSGDRVSSGAQNNNGWKFAVSNSFLPDTLYPLVNFLK